MTKDGERVLMLFQFSFEIICIDFEARLNFSSVFTQGFCGFLRQSANSFVSDSQAPIPPHSDDRYFYCIKDGVFHKRKPVQGRSVIDNIGVV